MSSLKKVALKLREQIVDGSIELESLGQQIIIRIREKGSFSAGSAFLQPQFIPVIREIGSLLADMPGEISVSGHSDSQQISNELYSSNWDLSAQRAVAVAEILRLVPNFDEKRMLVMGRADTQPLVIEGQEVDSDRSRRVEIAINQGKAKESEPISVSGSS